MKAVIEKVRDNVSSYTTPDGQMFVHAVTVGGNEFDYHSKSEQCVKFKAGEEAYFDLVDKETKRGISKRIVPLQAPRQFGAPSSNGFLGKKSYGTDKDQGLISWLSCFSSACTYNQQSSARFETVIEQANAAFIEAMKHSTK